MMVVKNENDGLLGVDTLLSPNFNERPEAAIVSLLVVHNISLPPGQYGGGYVEQFFTNQLPVNDDPFFQEIKDLQVSAHLLIERTGRVVQFVPLHKRAWHAGVSCYQGVPNCNDFSIGIELEGTDVEPYTPEQYVHLVELAIAIQAEFPAITNERIVGHSDIAPGRKTDPGPAFDWEYFYSVLNARQLDREKARQ
ncbi:MAG: AmpD protein [Neptuniibacter pectenicola]|jgi:AmpD protein